MARLQAPKRASAWDGARFSLGSLSTSTLHTISNQPQPQSFCTPRASPKQHRRSRRARKEEHNGEYIGNHVWSHLNNRICFIRSRFARKTHPGDGRFRRTWRGDSPLPCRARCPSRRRRARLDQGRGRDYAGAKRCRRRWWKLGTDSTRSRQSQKRAYLRRSAREKKASPSTWSSPTPA